MSDLVEAVAAQRLAGSDRPLAEEFDLAILDLDGVVYIGPDAVPGAADGIAAATRAGMRCCYVTNNASRPPVSVSDHLVRLGVPATVDDIVTSAQVAAALLARRLAPGSAVLVVGGEGLRVSLAAVGLVPVRSLEENPLAVVQGFSPDLDWRLLAEGTHAVRSGLYWVASNLDLTFPTPRGPAPGAGSFVRLLAGVVGREPDAVAGKPQPEPFLEAARTYGSARPLVVGDRLDTDLEGACAAGMAGLVVLTGLSGVTDLVTARRGLRPTFIGPDLASLLEEHPAVHVADVRATCRGAKVLAAEGTLTVESAGDDAVDLLRAGCAAAWAAADAGRPVDGPGTLLDAVRGLAPGAAWAR